MNNIIFLKRALFVLVSVTAISGIITSFYYYRQYKTIEKNPSIVAQREVETLVSAVNKLMELPTDETPTVATVLDREKLKDQNFFKNSQNGDKILAYNKAMKAILYRSSINKIIEVMPIYINQQEEAPAQQQESPAQAPTPTPTPTGPKVAYYNGTQITGLAEETKNLVKKTYSNYQEGALIQASRQDYKESLVVDLSGKYSAEAAKIANLLGVKVTPIPDGEIRPDADILVILGK